MRNEKGLTASGTAWKFLYGPKQILPEPGAGWLGCATPLAGHVCSYRSYNNIFNVIKWTALVIEFTRKFASLAIIS